MGASTHFIVVDFVIHGLAQIVQVLLAFQRIGHMYHGDVHFLLQGRGQIAVAVRHDDIAHSRMTSLCM